MDNNYYGQLKDERWLDKSEDIKDRDERTCQSCLRTDKILTVHHLVYHNGMNLWDYPDEEMLTLCKNCHEHITYEIKNITYKIRMLIRDDNYAEQLRYLIDTIIDEKMSPWDIRKLAKTIFDKNTTDPKKNVFRFDR